MEQRVGTYSCTGQNGRRVEVHVYHEMVDRTTLDDDQVQYSGRKRLQLKQGGPVNVVDENILQVVTTGELLTIKDRL